jgi:hypothetical protein
LYQIVEADPEQTRQQLQFACFSLFLSFPKICCKGLAPLWLSFGVQF